MDVIVTIFLWIGFYFIPIFTIIFCVNLVEIIKKVKKDENIKNETKWLTISFTIIVYSIIIAAGAPYTN